MDPSIYNLQYSSPAGLPQESKLLGYLNHSVQTSAQSHAQLTQSQMSQAQAQLSQAQLTQAMGNLNIEAQNHSGQSSTQSHAQLSQSQINQAQAQLSQAQLTQAMGNLNIDSQVLNKPIILPTQAMLSHPPPPQVLTQIPPPTLYQQVLIGEYVPINFFNPPSLIQETAGSSPPSAVTMQPLPPQPQVHQENVGGTTYFYTNDNGTFGAGGAMGPEPCLGASSSAAYVQQMYAPQHMPAHMPPVQANAGMATTYYRADPMKQEMYQRNNDMYTMSREFQQYQDIPVSIERFVDLQPLDDERTSFVAHDRDTREMYALRRVPFRTSPALPSTLDVWARLDHSNIVHFHRAFSTDAFGDESVVLVYDFHPGGETLMKKYLSVGAAGAGAEQAPRFHDPFSADPDAPRPYTHQKNTLLRAEICGALLPEQVLWNVFIQLTAALREIHSAGLACRTLEPSKVIVTGYRVRVSWCGIGDMLGEVDVSQAQQDDLTALGRLALALACRSPQVDNLSRCLDFVRRSYSEDLNNFIVYLLSEITIRSVTDLMPMIGGRFYYQVESLERRADALEQQLTRELDNGRHLRTLAMLGSVNERPEWNTDVTWSETGDRYMLKLFRDYVLHSVTPDGRPWLDQAHLAFALSNLDAGTNTKVLLTSRDDESVFVVTFAELKNCLEQAFNQLSQASSAPPP
ncbi:PAN2-PAN3 deadenylation complex subunit PAN3 [Bicyclus anynana]|uniref:PAN2-PAN3 deadenylation complex subunit PAN3 n=1 Tax=Bicyclus anynana TaxID=110368 RepID=A0ABM3M6U5_BICAN|nr:PAN2-PAN3 deadenylation complex subunit PAN3 [Bicyclus anynana]